MLPYFQNADEPDVEVGGASANEKKEKQALLSTSVNQVSFVVYILNDIGVYGRFEHKILSYFYIDANYIFMLFMAYVKYSRVNNKLVIANDIIRACLN